jgi:3-hydroxy-9,10-secoandrosta-1,3,5(10)-triene-9,17-dione monooxygenase reductase component
MSDALDLRAFRNALGQFATGVTIVTARDVSGERVGATVSSFNSVSLDPPMVLWSLDKRAHSRAIFEASTHFAVHVLRLEQQELARRFATRGANKFEGLGCDVGLGDVPLLSDCAACFECETKHRYDGGDHLIFVGEVQRFAHAASPPLVFHGGAFAQARQLMMGQAADGGIDEATGRFGPDFLCYLLARAHFQTYRPLADEFQRVGMSEAEYFVLSLLCIRDGLTLANLGQMLAHTGHAPAPQDIARMVAKQWITVEAASGAICITQGGRRSYVVVLALDGRIASKALSGFSAPEIVEFCGYLKRVIANTDAGTPDVWTYTASSAGESTLATTRPTGATSP